MPRNPTRYSKSMVTIHWLTALLILGTWLTSTGGRHMVENPPVLHFSLGLAVLVLVLPRLLLRLAGGVPNESPTSGWLVIAARVGHLVLYLFLIALPLSG